MLKVENVATPPLVTADVVPDSVPPEGLAPIAILTVPLKSETVAPAESTAATVMVPNDAPACADCGWAVNTRAVAMGGGGGSALMSKLELVPPVRPAALAVSVYPTPALSMLRVEKVATPFVAASTRVPESVPPPGLPPRAMVMAPVYVDTIPPVLSSAATWMAGAIGSPARAVVGWAMKAMWVGGGAGRVVTSKGELVAPASPLDAAFSVYPDPALLTLRPVNVAIPFVAVAVFAPDNVAPAALAPSEMVTDPEYPGTGWPVLSVMTTLTGGVIACPTPASFGWVEKATRAATV